MTAPQDQPQGWGPTPPPPTEPKPPKTRPFRAGFLGCFGVLAAAVVTTIVIALLASGGTETGKTTTVATPGATTRNEPATTTKAPAATPKPSDFTLTVKTLSKQCFGEAGCNVTYRVDVAYGGPTLDPGTTWAVTYEVRGVEDGPQINTMTVRGTKAATDEEEFASTPSASTKLKAIVTDVAEQ